MSKFSKPTNNIQDFSKTFKDHLHFQRLSRPWICSFKIQGFQGPGDTPIESVGIVQ